MWPKEHSLRVTKCSLTVSPHNTLHILIYIGGDAPSPSPAISNMYIMGSPVFFMRFLKNGLVKSVSNFMQWKHGLFLLVKTSFWKCKLILTLTILSIKVILISCQKLLFLTASWAFLSPCKNVQFGRTSESFNILVQWLPLGQRMGICPLCVRCWCLLENLWGKT